MPSGTGAEVVAHAKAVAPYRKRIAEQAERIAELKRRNEAMLSTVKAWAHEYTEGHSAIICQVCEAVVWPDQQVHATWCLVFQIEGLAQGTGDET